MKLVKNVYWYPEKAIGDCNTYLIDNNPCVLIDPGNPRYLSQRLSEMENDGFDIREIDLIANTHSHPDHCGANRALQTLSGAKIAMHREELEHLSFSMEFAGYFGMEMPKFDVDIFLEDKLGGKMKFVVIHTPGHTPGSVSFYCEELKLLMCGDLLFEGGVGRTDFPGGDLEKLKDSIRRVSELDIHYLLPGHGGVVKGAEKTKRNFEFIKEYFL